MNDAKTEKDLRAELAALRQQLADTTTPKKSKAGKLGSAIALMQAFIWLIFHFAEGNPQQGVVLSYATIMLTNGWALWEYVSQRARGRIGILGALAVSNIAGLAMASGCASFPASRGDSAEVRAVRDGDMCRILVIVDGHTRDEIEVSDCESLALPQCLEVRQP